MYAKKVEQLVIEEIVVEVHEELFHEFQQTFHKDFFGENFSYMTSSEYSKQEQPNQIREALEKGYVEMSHINLSICRECLHAEYEAEHMVERLVSGG